MMPVTKSLVAALAAIVSVSAAHAATVNVGGTGCFGMDTTPTAESAPGQTFTFSFLVPDPVSGTTETNLINPRYSLAANPIGPTITSIRGDFRSFAFRCGISARTTKSFADRCARSFGDGVFHTPPCIRSTPPPV